MLLTLECTPAKAQIATLLAPKTQSLGIRLGTFWLELYIQDFRKGLGIMIYDNINVI